MRLDIETVERDIRALYDGVLIAESGDLGRFQEWWRTRPPITMDMLMCGFNTARWTTSLLTCHRISSWLVGQLTP